jgi:tRNA-dihydrouridine synthase
VARKHLELSMEWKGEKKGIHEMRRHYTSYFRGVDNFKPLRIRIVQSESFYEINSILEEIEGLYQESYAV